jgi:hypothetical protein
VPKIVTSPEILVHRFGNILAFERRIAIVPDRL